MCTVEYIVLCVVFFFTGFFLYIFYKIIKNILDQSSLTLWDASRELKFNSIKEVVSHLFDVGIRSQNIFTILATRSRLNKDNLALIC